MVFTKKGEQNLKRGYVGQKLVVLLLSDHFLAHSFWSLGDWSSSGTNTVCHFGVKNRREEPGVSLSNLSNIRAGFAPWGTPPA